ncbi:MAG: hypothetical protein A2V77_02420 [Anaeromyxobacter sp. RBG_16_69_14]|nr:MAG: hypothetical protein A2V77_02420 [Anaeromyxobacter sp. RBG_16_69_14]HJW74307.1 hypothetical protein [Thermoleophilia bacterium]
MRGLARLLFLAGAVGIGLFFLRAAPRDVTLVYAVGGSGGRALEVDIEKGGAAIRRAEFHLAEGAPAQVSHRVRLTDGEYVVHLTLMVDGASRRLERSISVSESGTIVIPIEP